MRMMCAALRTGSLVLTVVLLTGCPATSLQGDPQTLASARVYTFISSVTMIEDGAGAAAAAGVVPRTGVEYKVLIDTASPAFAIDNKGNRIELTDGVAVAGFEAGLDYFRATLLSGSLIDEVDGGRFNGGSDIAEFHIGAEGGSQYKGELVLGSNDNTIVIASPGGPVKDWVAGTKVFATETAHSSTGGETSVNCMIVNLSSIEPYEP